MLTIADHIAGCTAAHARLLAHLDASRAAGELDDARVRSASALPGWTVGHVLTHLARNADSFVHVLTEVERGAVPDQYPGGPTARNGAIEAGAARPAAEQLADLRRSIGELEACWASCSDSTWQGRWRNAFGEVPAADLAFRRWREVEVHHADLGLVGFGIENWSAAYVAEDLDRQTMTWTSRQPMGLTALPAAALALSPPLRLAWLLGRATPAGLEPVTF